ncbi:MAG: hypothetical protein DRP87_19465 [Spirochaetes bacterium]|nr:MAG: hypothetical protein DRP87_19465 [Spirochaetota bacterium]
MHKNQIFFFTAQKINEIGEYERFFHTKRYIESINPVKKSRFKMMATLGYSNMKKFITLKKEWDQLRRNIPLSYFDYIGLNREVLEFTLELDWEEYEQALQIPRYPHSAIVRIMSAVYKNITIPTGSHENEAIAYLFDFMKEKRFRCCINYPQLLSIFLEPNGDIKKVYYPPSIRFTKTSAIPEKDGSGIGTSYLG